MLDMNQESTENQVNKVVESDEVVPTETGKTEDVGIESSGEASPVPANSTVKDQKGEADQVKESTEEVLAETVKEGVEESANLVVVDSAVKGQQESVDKAVEEIEEKVAEEAEKEAEKNVIPMLDYASMDLEALVDALEKLLKEYPVQQLKKNTDAIKNVFNAKFGALLAEKKASFLADGGDSIDFQYSSPVKSRYNALLSDYKKRRDAYYSELETRLKENLAKRHSVIHDLKSLIADADTKTMYKSFKALQTRWRDIGPVPRNKYNDTWRNYHHHVERFYDLLHLSNDFRDLDFKHNLEEKLKLIAKVEALAELENVNDAFKELQQFHKTWKEDIGPVSQEHREEVWQKFSAASKRIHDKRHEYFRSLRSQHQSIIEAKLAIIEKIAAYDTSMNKKHSDWQRSIKEVEAMRTAYFDAGKLPYSKSEQLWQKFKTATKAFNHAKNAFYKVEKSTQQANLDKKNALIELAESLQESDDWENTTNVMKKIQADWKKIGHVPRKFSDPIWKRFKAACNLYFDRLHNKQDADNKEQIAFIEEKKAYLETVKTKNKASLEEINNFIQQWRAFGETPKSVRHIESKFNRHIDKLLEGLSMSPDEIAMLKFKNLVDGYLAQNDGHKLNSEQLFVRKKIDEINKEIQQLENNLSFFSNAANDNPLLLNVRASIDKHINDVAIWKQKLAYIKSLDY